MHQAGQNLLMEITETQTAQAHDALSFEHPADTCWQAWFDGSAKPNPGTLGIGLVLLSPLKQRYEKSERLACQGCNNEAELYALCAVFEMAFAAGARRLLVRGDSDVAIRYVLKLDSTTIEPLKTQVAQAQQWLECFDEVCLQWIPRHRNRDADRLSRQALGLPEKLLGLIKKKRRQR
jgi:ribonuclease HI